MEELHIIGVDLAKRVFQLHGSDSARAFGGKVPIGRRTWGGEANMIGGPFRFSVGQYTKVIAVVHDTNQS